MGHIPCCPRRSARDCAHTKSNLSLMSCQLSKSAKFNKVELVLTQPSCQGFFEEAIHQDGRTELKLLVLTDTIVFSGQVSGYMLMTKQLRLTRQACISD